MRWRFAALGAGVLVALTSAPWVAPGALAQEAVGNDEPAGPAAVRFAEDFPALVDHEWDFPLGGFGGISRGAPLAHAPVVFVHGNNTDHGDWYPVRDDFRAAGWSDQELWGVSYNGVGCSSGASPSRPNPEADADREEAGADGRCRITSNEANVGDLHDFILAVREYTGSDRFSIVAHSLGVTVARRTLQVHPELRADLVGFVGIAGGNHGTSLCPPGSGGALNGCDELEAGSEWLAKLNGPDGSEETYGPARWLTVYDGSGAADVAYLGPDYAESPMLRGADNRAYGLGHSELRLDPAVVAEYRAFLEDADAAAVAAAEVVPPVPSPAAGAGGGATPRPGGGPPTAAGRPAPRPNAASVLAPAAPTPSAVPPPSSELAGPPVVPSAVAGVTTGFTTPGGPVEPGPYRVALVALAALGAAGWYLTNRFLPPGQNR